MTDKTSTTTTTAGYLDSYLLPVPADRLDAYRRQATAFGEVAEEHGALRHREFHGDDLGDKLSVRDGAVLTAAVAEFASRAHRDEVIAAPSPLAGTGGTAVRAAQRRSQRQSSGWRGGGRLTLRHPLARFLRAAARRRTRRRFRREGGG